MCACWQASAFEMFVENNALGSLGRFSLSPSAVTFSSQSVIVIPSIGCRAILGVVFYLFTAFIHAVDQRNITRSLKSMIGRAENHG